MMNNWLVFVTCIVSCAALPSKQVWTEESLKSATQTGVHRVLNEGVDFAGIPTSARDEIEWVVVEHLAEGLSRRFRVLDVAIEGSFSIAQDFIKDAVHSSIMRTRWPTVSLMALLEGKAAEAQSKVSNLYRSMGLIQPTCSSSSSSSSSSSQISALNLEQIIDDIIQTLMQDPSFLSLINWLQTLPTVLHEIADTFLANKTFKEIFAMLGAGTNTYSLEDVMGDIAPPEPGSPVTTSALRLVEAGLKEAQPSIELATQTHQQAVKDNIQNLIQLIQEQRVPFINDDVIEYIKKVAIKLVKNN